MTDGGFGPFVLIDTNGGKQTFANSANNSPDSLQTGHCSSEFVQT
jgi:hypothetical protein